VRRDERKKDERDFGQTMESMGYSEDEVYAVYANSGNLPEPTAFPTHALHRSCKRLVEEAAASIMCPPEFIALALVTELGCAIGNSRRVKLKEGWDEGAALYAAVVADPGDKKTPAYKVAVQPSVKREAKLRSDYQEKKDEYQRELREYEVDKADARKDGVAAPPPPEAPARHRVLVEDTTIEALARILDTNPRGVFVVRDELAAWKRSMDQYRSGGKGTDRQFWLSAWSNSYASVDRKGRDEPVVLPKPFVGVFGSIQPAVLPELSGEREDGLLDRFLFAYPDSMQSRWSDDEISANTVGNVKWLYDRLMGLEAGEDEYGDPEPVLVAMSKEARTLFIDFTNALREEMEAPGFPARLKGPWAKMEAYLARLALIVGLCRVVADDATERIEQVDVLSASILLDYFKAHARRVYVGLYGHDRIDLLGEDVARLLEKHGGSWSGQPQDFYRTLKSRHKPSRAKDLSADVSEVARRSAALVFEAKHEAFVKDGGTRSTRRVWTLGLKNSVNSVNGEEEGSGGV